MVLPVTSLGPLRGVWGRVVRSYKEDPVSQVAGMVEPMLAARLLADWVRGPARDGSSPVLVPVPMAPVRRRQRGVNPPELLALAAARRLGWGTAPDALRRVRYSRPLRGLSASARRQEMTEAIRPGSSACGLSGARVWLIDDVLTTGATLRSSAEALRVIGVSVEGAWTLGRTTRRRRIVPAVP
jgi:predicted amidophosphoribosyltransferase